MKQQRPANRQIQTTPASSHIAGALDLNRRSFMIGLAGSSVLMAFTQDATAITQPNQVQAKLQTKSFHPTIWYSIDSNGQITIHIKQAEIGQHIGTALARIAADELEAHWQQVTIDYVKTAPQWGNMETGGSLSVWTGFEPYSQAAAAGRLTLIESAARLLGVPAQQCIARNSQILAGGSRISYADIVRYGHINKVYSPAELKKIALKPVRDYRLIGRPVAALDIPDKTNGRARYGIDAVLPDMVYARPKIPPTRHGSTVISIDDSEAHHVKGYQKSLILQDPSNTVPGWVMVIADSFHAADQAAEKVQVIWANDAAIEVSESHFQREAHRLIHDAKAGVLAINDPGLDEAFKKASHTVEHSYTTASVAHFTLEPVNALVCERAGRWEVHTSCQWPTLAQHLMAKALNVQADQIVFHPYYIGGGFGRRLVGDYVVPAALAAKALRKPVKLVLTRSDDMGFDCFRSPSVQQLKMAFDASGKVCAMQHDTASGWPGMIYDTPQSMAQNEHGQRYDLSAFSGADHWYNVGPQRVRVICNQLINKTCRPGWLRSVGPGWINWALECFMDEAAHARNLDPLDFRLSLLDGHGKNAGTAPNSSGGALRQAAVLKQVTRRAQWATRKQLGPHTGMGIATTFGAQRSMPTWVACVALVHVDQRTGDIEVKKIWASIDAGIIIDPNGALAQAEGSILWGLSLALHESSHFQKGRLADTNLNTYTPLRINQVPELAIEFMKNDHPPTGLGEPGMTMIAPAISNAIYAAVGIRLRDLPMRPQDVLNALQGGPRERS